MHVIVHARRAVDIQHHAHFLQHVAVIVDPGLIDAERHFDTLVEKAVDRGDA